MMKNVERGTGVLIAATAIAFFIFYVYLLIFSPWREIVLNITILAIVGIIVGAVVWLGITIAKTPREVRDR